MRLWRTDLSLRRQPSAAVVHHASPAWAFPVTRALLLGFSATVLVEHALERQLVPARCTISEYANTPTGAVVVTGFAAWSASVALLAFVTARTEHRARSRFAVAACLASAATGIALIAAFPTQSVEGVVPPGVGRTTQGRLHDVGGEIVTWSLLAAAAACIVTEIPSARLRTPTAVCVAIAAIATAALLPLGHGVGGIRQRVVVAAGVGWQFMMLRELNRVGSPRLRSCTKRRGSGCSTS